MDATCETAQTVKPNGFIMVMTTVVLAVLTTLVIYTVNFTITENRIAGSQLITVQTYYLAESGIAAAIWKIKNDATWKNNFETDPNWAATFTQSPALYTNGSYEIAITNSGPARGEITSTGVLNINGHEARRVIKIAVFKATGDSPLANNATYADGNIDINYSLINIYNGDMLSNNNILFSFLSTINVDGDIKAVNNINQEWFATVTANNLLEGVAFMSMPAISFDNPGDQNSYKNRANAIYTENQFETLQKDNAVLTLPGPITYVTGDVYMRGGTNLIINGVLATDGNVYPGYYDPSCCWQGRCGAANITVNQPTGNLPSGILTKGRINFGGCLGNFNAIGILYANDKINIVSIPGSFNLTGGMASRKLTIISVGQGINITRESNAVANAFGDPIFSPIVTVEHWEEEY